jgi:hypothetical protein
MGSLQLIVMSNQLWEKENKNEPLGCILLLLQGFFYVGWMRGMLVYDSSPRLQFGAL